MSIIHDTVSIKPRESDGIVTNNVTVEKVLRLKMLEAMESCPTRLM